MLKTEADFKSKKLFELIHLLLEKKNFILVYLCIYSMIGVMVAFTSQKKYTADSVFMPQLESSNSSGVGDLGGLASLAGFELGGINGGNTDFPPSLYPNLLDNIDIQLKLINSKIYVEKLQDSLSYRVYYDSLFRPSILSLFSKYTVGLPSLVKGALRSNSSNSDTVEMNTQSAYYRMDSEEFEHISRLKKQVSLEPNMDEGYVTLSFTMDNPDYAAQMAGHLEKIIHRELITFRMDKLNQDLNYLSETYDIRKKEYLEAQKTLSRFRDQNIVLATSSAKNELERLEDEYDLAFQVFKEIATSLEQKRIDLSKNTPLIKTIKPIIIPYEKSAPKSALIVIVFAFLGLIVGCIRIIAIPFLKQLKENYV